MDKKLPNQQRLNKIIALTAAWGYYCVVCVVEGGGGGLLNLLPQGQYHTHAVCLFSAGSCYIISLRVTPWTLHGHLPSNWPWDTDPTAAN